MDSTFKARFLIFSRAIILGRTEPFLMAPLVSSLPKLQLVHFLFLNFPRAPIGSFLYFNFPQERNKKDRKEKKEEVLLSEK